jgi:hypothetical protein
VKSDSVTEKGMGRAQLIRSENVTELMREQGLSGEDKIEKVMWCEKPVKKRQRRNIPLTGGI